MLSGPDTLVNEEIVWNNWLAEQLDSSLSDEVSWEILNQSDSDDIGSRHWFKQNYVHQMPQNATMITYH